MPGSIVMHHSLVLVLIVCDLTSTHRPCAVPCAYRDLCSPFLTKDAEKFILDDECIKVDEGKRVQSCW